MGTRVQWQGTVPAGADADKMYVIGAVPEGKKLIVSCISYYGGDSGERYGINVVPSGQNVEDQTVDADLGQMNWLYPMSGGAQTVSSPVSIVSNNGWCLLPLVGPCTIAASTYFASAAKLVVNVLGILEDL